MVPQLCFLLWGSTLIRCVYLSYSMYAVCGPHLFKETTVFRTGGFPILMAALLLSHPFFHVIVFHVTSNLRLCRIMMISLTLDQRFWSKIEAEKNCCTCFVLFFPALERGWCRGIR